MMCRTRSAKISAPPPGSESTPAAFLNKDESQGWEFLASRTSTTKNEYVKGLGFDDRKAQRHLKKFVELGILRRVGAGPSTSYEVVRA